MKNERGGGCSFSGSGSDSDSGSDLGSLTGSHKDSDDELVVDSDADFAVGPSEEVVTVTIVESSADMAESSIEVVL